MSLLQRQYTSITVSKTQQNRTRKMEREINTPQLNYLYHTDVILNSYIDILLILTHLILVSNVSRLLTIC